MNAWVSGAAAFGFVLMVSACKPDWPREDQTTTGKPVTQVPCDLGPADRFVVSPDSVGQFAVATTTMDDVVSSCGSVTTEWESRCCYMAVMARLDYPGVHVGAEQESQDSVARPLSRVIRWEITGDSVYIAGRGLMPSTVADLSRMFGPGWAENPTHDDNDGPKAFVCALPTIAFRVKVPPSVTVEKWLVDTSEVNRDTRIIGMVVTGKQRLDVTTCGRAGESP